MSKTALAFTLYRAILSTARRYAKGAEKRNLPARKEMEIFNSAMKSVRLPLPESGIMTPQIAIETVKKAFRQPLDSQQADAYIMDGFAVLRKLRQKETILNRFPIHTWSECVTHGCKVDAKSRYLWERPPNWYTWEYTVKIINPTDRTLQLFTEKLHTVDEDFGERNLEVALIGSLKTLPVIKPGGHFEFTKKMHFRTKSGSLSGSYTLIDLDNGELIQANMSPILLTSNIEDEILQSMHASSSSATDGDEERKRESHLRGGARRRRLQREQDFGDAKLEHTDSKLPSKIKQGFFKPQSTLSSSSTKKFTGIPCSSKNSTSSRQRAQQRAAITTAKKQESENEETVQTKSTDVEQ